MARIMLYVAANLLSLSQVECCVKNLFFLNWVKMVSRTSGENYKSPEGQVKKSVSHMEKKNSHVFSQMERNVERLSWQNFFSSSSKVINPGVKITEIRKWPLFSSDLNWSDLSFVQDTDWNWVGEKNSNVLHSISDRKKKISTWFHGWKKMECNKIIWAKLFLDHQEKKSSLAPQGFCTYKSNLKLLQWN